MDSFNPGYRAECRASFLSQIIQRAGDLPAHRFRQRRVNLRRPHIRVTQQLLHGPDVDPPQHQVRCKAVAQHMGRHPLAQACQLRRLLQLPCDGDLMQVMPPSPVGACTRPWATVTL